MRLALLAVLLSACSATNLPPSTSSTGMSSTGTSDAIVDDTTGEAETTEGTSTGEDATATTSTSAGADTSTASSDSSSSNDATTGPGSACGDGRLDPGEACDDGQETKLCDDDCSVVACGDAHVNEAAGEACDDGNVDNADACLEDCTVATCGDGAVWAGAEECDDGNTEPGDGCDEFCALERWAHEGVAHDVPVADLYLWEPEPCWLDTYEAGELLADVPAACTGDHLLMACRPKGADVLTLAAHAPREAVFAEVNYEANERTLANGVDFYWSPYYEGALGFGPPGAAYCYGQGTSPGDNLCWKVGGNLPQKFVAGRQCGTLTDMSIIQTQEWERVIFEAWD